MFLAKRRTEYEQKQTKKDAYPLSLRLKFFCSKGKRPVDTVNQSDSAGMESCIRGVHDAG